MRQIRTGIADALHDRELARLPERHERRKRGMKPVPVVELEHIIAPDRDPRPEAVVRGIGVRHDRVKSVVATLQFDQHQEP